MNVIGRAKKALRLTCGVLLLVGAAAPAAAATVTIEEIAKSGLCEDPPVPGRSVDDPQIVFWGEDDMCPPSINGAGEAVFRAKSAKSYDQNTAAAVGIYVHRPGEGLAVLVDTTAVASGAGTFEVPGYPDARFWYLIGSTGNKNNAPLLNNAGDVVFWAQYTDPAPGVGTQRGLFATKITGGPIVKLVDTLDQVPGHEPETFSGLFDDPSRDNLPASLNNNGQVVFWGTFNGTADHGIYGTTVSGGAPVLLADTTQFSSISSELAINNSGTVTFQGQLGDDGGIFSVPVAGGTITTVALAGQPAPESSFTFSNSFSGPDINDAGTIVFRNTPAASKWGLYAFDPTVEPPDEPHSVIVDNFGGFDVPNRAGGTFDIINFATINETGQMGFFATVSSTEPYDRGIYAAGVASEALDVVVDRGTEAPGLTSPAELRYFDGGSAAINDDGHMAFWAGGVDESLASLMGVYFFDACNMAPVRIVDSTTAATDLGQTGLSSFSLYQFGDVRSGHYRSINNNNDVAFLAQFGTVGFGMYIAHVTAEGGTPSITCPPDVGDLECPADTSPTATGEATASGCGTITVTFGDSSEVGCGDTETITRAWTATSTSGGSDSCDQIIGTVDTEPPAVTVDTTPITVVDTDCSGDEAVTVPVATADDECEGPISVTDDAPATFPAGETTAVTYSASDNCGNAETAIVDVTVDYGANIEIRAATHTVGSGAHPGSTKEPLVGIDVCAYDKSEGSCAQTDCGGISHQHYSCIALGDLDGDGTADTDPCD
jgi:hypothetical protein